MDEVEEERRLAEDDEPRQPPAPSLHHPVGGAQHQPQHARRPTAATGPRRPVVVEDEVALHPQPGRCLRPTSPRRRTPRAAALRRSPPPARNRAPSASLRRCAAEPASCPSPGRSAPGSATATAGSRRTARGPATGMRARRSSRATGTRPGEGRRSRRPRRRAGPTAPPDSAAARCAGTMAMIASPIVCNTPPAEGRQVAEHEDVQEHSGQDDPDAPWHEAPRQHAEALGLPRAPAQRQRQAEADEEQERRRGQRERDVDERVARPGHLAVDPARAVWFTTMKTSANPRRPSRIGEPGRRSGRGLGRHHGVPSSRSPRRTRESASLR